MNFTNKGVSLGSYKSCFFTFCFLLLNINTYATHNRAGEIVYQVIAPFTIKATIYTYTKESSVAADRPSLELFWGDGTSDTLNRINGPVVGGIPNGESLGNDIKKNLYVGVHTYPGAAPPPNNFYVISMQDPNRIGGILNIANSVDKLFYIEDTLKFPADLTNIGYNSSPILLNPPIDFACVGDTFIHNPLAYDPDGDSLVFEKMTPLQAQGVLVDNNYKYPNGIIPSANNNYTLNRNTGEIIWAVPQESGIYNVAIMIHEYRRGINMGTMIRDMQIIVGDCNNHPPQIAAILDTCIRAGDTLLKAIHATDLDVGQLVTLSADGAPFQFASTLSPSTFTTAVGNPVSSVFRWNTICNHIRRQPYMVLFKAVDNFSTPLTDEQTWLIEVIAPPPLNLQATATKASINLSWDVYKCASFADFRGFSVWRKLGSNPFIPDYCETGLAGRGYTKIADKIQTLAYQDFTAVRGQEYCYRILAHFSKKSPNGLIQYDEVVSVPSQEVCVNLPLDLPVITQVSVNKTDVAAGKMDIKWVNPKAGGINLDTVLFPPPYRLDLFRSAGFNLSNPNLIKTFTSPTYSLLIDTFYQDNLLNTQDSAYSYKISFWDNADSLGSSSKASSVYLNLKPYDKSLVLSWAFNVPWTNDTFQILKKNPVTLNFDYLATTNQLFYTDTALINDSLYCYQIKAFGHYGNPLIQKPLINFSEEKCGRPLDTIPPCAPTVKVSNDCDRNLEELKFINYLNWTNDYSCDTVIKSYRIYFGTDSNSLKLVSTTTDSFYTDILQDNLAGCYAVTALDNKGNESKKSNIFCVDNCPVYILPNSFSPNGDGQNDLFKPRKPVRFVSKVELKIFNRWGEKVFETADPQINWDGKDYKTNKDLSEGVYFYAGYYWEKRLGGEIKTPLPHKNGSGEIHLIRGK